MSNMFTPSSTNNGLLVDYSFYLEDEASSDDIGKSVLDSLVADQGVSITDMVNMMVRGKMGYKVEEKQAEITNTNIQYGALSTLKTTLSVFQSNTIVPLNNPNALSSYSITNTNQAAVSASIGSDGLSDSVDMNLDVDQTAQAQTLTIGGFSDPNAPLDEGAFVINFGSYESGTFENNDSMNQVTVEIVDPMDLYDVTTSINNQTNQVEASVVENGDGTYALAVMGTQTGDNTAMQIVSSGGGTNDNFSYDGSDTGTVTEKQAAQNAKYSINGVPMESETNNVSHMGLDITLMAPTDSPVKLSSEPNPDAVVANVSSFVENYNATIDQFNLMIEMVPDQGYIGSLYDTNIANDISDALDGMWDDMEEAGVNISDLGMTINPDGTIYFNEAALRKNLDEDPNIVKDTMGSISELSNSDTYEVVSAGNTVDGTHEFYVDTAPEQAELKGAPMNDPTVLATDTTIGLNLGGEDVEITLTAGSYTPQQIAAEINNEIMLAGISGYNVTLSDNNELVFKSSEYGTMEWIEVTTGSPELGIADGDKDAGQDVKGYINGQRFIGSGTTITTMDDATDGLEIEVDPDKLTLNETVTLTTQTGVLDRMDATFDYLIDPVDGIIIKEVVRLEELLSETGSDSLLVELEELEAEEEMWYEYYSDYYSGLTASLAAFDETQDFLDTMFNDTSD
ncbi:flagellar filament capping protein FliD [Vibrio crassostreae]|uniref:flagellar filament capping protein FliD n=1 Tax=Vibrio crassostreae TaxID=246167 RepID=UPI001B305120|nr:flagellar filament capping protein FliD [Vibrio crassostreae]